MTATIGMASILPQPPSQKVVVTREVFERICAPAFERIKQPLRQVLYCCDLHGPETAFTAVCSRAPQHLKCVNGCRLHDEQPVQHAIESYLAALAALAGM